MSLSNIVFLFRNLFKLTEYPEIDSDKDKYECQKIVRFRAWMMIVIFSVCLFFYLFKLLPIVFHSINAEESFSFASHIDRIILIVSAIIVICYSVGVLRHWKVKKNSEFIDINKVEELFNERYVLDARTCMTCDKYSDSEKLIEKDLDDKPHKNYIEYFLKATSKGVSELNAISIDFSNEKEYAKLLCVLSNPQYYDLSNIKQLASLTEYFVSFFPHISERKRIKRIFCLSSLGEKNNASYQEKCKWFFQYVLVNYITGVETCVLLDEEGLKCHIDYVVGKYPGKPARLYSLRKLYFSYERPGGRANEDNTIISNDQLLINTMEKDFYERWYGYKINKNNNLQIPRNRLFLKDNKKVKKLFDELELDSSSLQEISQNIKQAIDSFQNDKTFKERHISINGLKNKVDTVIKAIG